MNQKAKYPALIISIIIVLLGIPKTSQADGIYFKQRLVPKPDDVSKLIHSPHQKAVIVWDPETNKEIMIISTTAKSEDLTNLCWLVPIKSAVEPTIKACNFDIFKDIAQEFAPRIRVPVSPVYGFGYGYELGFEYPQGIEMPGVIEIDFEEIDVYDLYILYVTNAQTLAQWLRDHDFFLPDGALDVFTEYTQEGCYFIANRIDLVNKHAELLYALEEHTPDLYLDLMSGREGIDLIIDHIKRRILEDAKDSVTYEASVARYFINIMEYTYTWDYPFLSSEVTKKISGKFSSLKKTVSELRSGVATPLSFEFYPSGEMPVYPLILTSLVPEDIHIEVYIIAPYRVFDLNGILIHDPPVSESDITESSAPNRISVIYEPYHSPLWDFYYMPDYGNEKDYNNYKVFLLLPYYLVDKIKGEYGIPLPQGDLWGTRMVYKGKAEGLKKDALFMDIQLKYYYDSDIRPIAPNLFEMGPLYALIFEPYRYLFVADYTGANIESFTKHKIFEFDFIMDLMLNPNNFLLTQDPNDPNDPVVRYWIDLGADSNRFGENDPNISRLFEKDSFAVDLSLPIFADPNLRLGGPGAKSIISQGTLGWNVWINGYGASLSQPFLMQALPVYPYDGMPTYLPSYYRAIDAVKRFGKPFFSPELVILLEGALWNAGVTVWPNIAALDYTPQYFEDLIVTIEVTNGVHSDVRTFPISVVNYPVENYNPVLQTDALQPGLEAQTFYVGEMNEYLVNFIDPDCFIFCMSPEPKISHLPGPPISEDFRRDMEYLTWGFYISEPPSYHYGPWIYDGPSWFDGIIESYSGLIRWIPKVKGVYDCIVTCSDARGGTAFGKITIECIYPHSKANYYQTLIPLPTIHLLPIVPGVLLGSPGTEVYTPYDLFGHTNMSLQNVLMMMHLSGFPPFYQGVSGIQDFILVGGMGEYDGMDALIETMPWWAYRF